MLMRPAKKRITFQKTCMYLSVPNAFRGGCFALFSKKIKKIQNGHARRMLPMVRSIVRLVIRLPPSNTDREATPRIWIKVLRLTKVCRGIGLESPEPTTTPPTPRPALPKTNKNKSAGGL